MPEKGRGAAKDQGEALRSKCLSIVLAEPGLHTVGTHLRPILVGILDDLSEKELDKLVVAEHLVGGDGVGIRHAQRGCPWHVDTVGSQVDWLCMCRSRVRTCIIRRPASSHTHRSGCRRMGLNRIHIPSLKDQKVNEVPHRTIHLPKRPDFGHGTNGPAGSRG